LRSESKKRLERAKRYLRLEMFYLEARKFQSFVVERVLKLEGKFGYR